MLFNKAWGAFHLKSLSPFYESAKNVCGSPPDGKETIRQQSAI
jgi:hypothetical protein